MHVEQQSVERVRVRGRRSPALAAVLGLVMSGSLITASAAGGGTASSFVPITPCRLVDTRAGADNVGPRAVPLGAAETFTTAVRGSNGNCVGIPADVTGVSMNVTIVNPSASSFLTVFPADAGSLPVTANLNWVGGQAPTPNAVTAALAVDGRLSFYNASGTVDLVVDVVGYYQPATAAPAGPAGPAGATGATGPVGPAGPAAIGVPGPTNVGHVSATVDATGTTGYFSSVTIGTDGFPVIAYQDSTSSDLRVAHCDDVACSSATRTTVDATANNTGFHPAVTIGSDGLPLISYADGTNGDLRVAHCTNVACTSSSTVTVDATGDTGYYTSVTIGVDGLPVVSYFDATNGDLRVAQCNDVACATATRSTVDATGTTGYYSSVAVGVDGLPVVSYFDVTNGDLRLAHCSDGACTSSTRTTVDAAGTTGWYTSVAVGVDGLPVVSYFDVTNGDLRLAHCSDVECSSKTLVTVEATGSTGYYTSLIIGVDGFPAISSFDATNADLRLTHCSDVACARSTRTTIDAVGATGYYTSVTMGVDGFPLISYHDGTNGDLRVAHCTNVFCVPNTGRG